MNQLQTVDTDHGNVKTIVKMFDIVKPAEMNSLVILEIFRNTDQRYESPGKRRKLCPPWLGQARPVPTQTAAGSRSQQPKDIRANPNNKTAVWDHQK